MVHRIRMTHWLVSGALLLAASSASAQEGMLFKNLMEGVFGGGSNDIEYRQRPPLVVPPGSALPRPQEPSSTRNAAWPNDPDVARRRAEAANARTPATQTERYRANASNTVLSQEDIRRGRTSADLGRPTPTYEQNTYNNQIEPIRIGKEMAARLNADDMSNLVYGQEPPRRTLTDPPVGYRRPAGTAPTGPGRGGPVEDKQSAGQLEFVTGTKPMMQQ